MSNALLEQASSDVVEVDDSLDGTGPVERPGGLEEAVPVEPPVPIEPPGGVAPAAPAEPPVGGEPLPPVEPVARVELPVPVIPRAPVNLQQGDGRVAMPKVDDVPVSLARIRECEASARFWCDELPRYADRKQYAAEFWAILAGVLTGITGLAVWPVVAEGSPLWQKAVVSAFALTSVVCGLVPRVKNYAEQAATARELSSQYGIALGMLVDLMHLADRHSLDAHQPSAHRAMEYFQTAKSRKDALRWLPDRRAIERMRERQDQA